MLATTLYVTSKDDCIIQSLAHCQNLIWKLAHNFKLDYDELEQEAALALLRAWPETLAPFGAELPSAIPYTIVRNKILNFIRKEQRAHRAVSLDVPVKGTSGQCEDILLSDTLAAPPHTSDPAELYQQATDEKALYAAIARLVPQEQAYLAQKCSVNVDGGQAAEQLPPYGTHAYVNIRDGAKRHLRNDPRLRREVLAS